MMMELSMLEKVTVKNKILSKYKKATFFHVHVSQCSMYIRIFSNGLFEFSIKFVISSQFFNKKHHAEQEEFEFHRLLSLIYFNILYICTL